MNTESTDIFILKSVYFCSDDDKSYNRHSHTYIMPCNNITFTIIIYLWEYDYESYIFLPSIYRIDLSHSMVIGYTRV